MWSYRTLQKFVKQRCQNTLMIKGQIKRCSKLAILILIGTIATVFFTIHEHKQMTDEVFIGGRDY